MIKTTASSDDVNRDVVVRILLEAVIAVPLLVLGAVCIIFFDSLSIFYIICVAFTLVVVLFLIYVAFIKDRMPDKTGHVMIEAEENTIPIQIRCTKYIFSRKPLHVEVNGKIVVELYRGNSIVVPLHVGKSDIFVYPNPIDVRSQSFSVNPGTSFFVWENDNGANYIIDNNGAQIESSLENRYALLKKRQKLVASIFTVIGLSIVIVVGSFI